MKRHRKRPRVLALRRQGLGPFECALLALIAVSVAITVVMAIVNP
jgi:hypothetical protein